MNIVVTVFHFRCSFWIIRYRYSCLYSYLAQHIVTYGQVPMKVKCLFRSTYRYFHFLALAVQKPPIKFQNVKDICRGDR